MTRRKTRVAVLFGGRSAEHEVSITSARSLLQAIDRDKYDVTMIPITKEGRWLPASAAPQVLEAGIAKGKGGGPPLVTVGSDEPAPHIDVVFPLLHGPCGEDGTVQGLLELAAVAYVGSGVLGSAVGMDKEMMKRALRAEGLPIVESAAILRSKWRADPRSVQAEIETRFSYPVFVKPANMGSSVGISKVSDQHGLCSAMDNAARYDRKIIVEADAGACREVECAVLGYEDPQVSVVGEVVSAGEFYDYESKYVDDNSELIIPAKLAPETTKTVQEFSRRAFLAVEASGLARVDFFVAAEGEVIVNEINTMPGFTPISMYPKLWEASGLGYGELIDQLIQLALQRHVDRQEITVEGCRPLPPPARHSDG